jgi:opacity protein-like surface antigen
MRVRRGVLLTLAVVACAAAPAPAQWVVTPYLGTNFGDVEKGKGGIGGSIGYFAGRVGFELDLERHWHFFKDAKVDIVSNNCGVVARDVACVDIDTRATSFMGNLMLPFRIKGATTWRPYGTAGLGVIRATFKDGGQINDHQNDFAFNVGGGVMHRPGSRVGLRADLRYFRALVDKDRPEGGYHRDYGFLRLTFGATFGFPR